MEKTDQTKGFSYNIYNRALPRYQLLENATFDDALYYMFKGKRKKNRKKCQLCNKEVLFRLNE